MRDKQFNFPITIITEPIDPEFQIDDDCFGGGDVVTTPSTSGRNTPYNNRYDVETMSFHQERRALLSTLQDMVNGMKHSDDNINQSVGEDQQALVHAINVTTSTIEKFEKQHLELKKSLKLKKRKLSLIIDDADSS
jgi:hypothetical protein